MNLVTGSAASGPTAFPDYKTVSIKKAIDIGTELENKNDNYSEFFNLLKPILDNPKILESHLPSLEWRAEAGSCQRPEGVLAIIWFHIFLRL